VQREGDHEGGGGIVKGNQWLPLFYASPRGELATKSSEGWNALMQSIAFSGSKRYFFCIYIQSESGFSIKPCRGNSRIARPTIPQSAKLPAPFAQGSL